MSKRSTNALHARQTVQIMEQGFYIHAATGKQVDIQKSLQQAVQQSVHYTPEKLAEVVQKVQNHTQAVAATTFEVTNETTLHAAKRLLDKGFDKVLALNFASAKNPGGGFLNGAQAQEESLARASGLYATLLHNWDYYETHRGFDSCLYTDHMIYSPHVPVLRDDWDALLETPHLVSFITSPAVNAGVVMQRNNLADQEAIPQVMRDRTEKVLAIAKLHGYKALVLGAWGCGVFRNKPVDVAGYFYEHLVKNPVFNQAFETVIFAVYHSDEAMRTPFVERFLP